jgi:heme/copper-type cytochrome/quinol oxidase subunit 3
MMTGVAEARRSIPRTVITDRGTWAMAMFIATEATLFVCLFFAYYYLGHVHEVWPPEPPEWKMAVVMLVVLLTSSAVLHWGETRLRRGLTAQARAATAVTVLIGMLFLGLQVVEYRHHLETLQPTSDAYGSIFYTITSIHAAHLLLGLMMLGFVLALPEIGEAAKPPHRALHNASLYWHFVDAVWLIIVVLLYVMPNLRSLS